MQILPDSACSVSRSLLSATETLCERYLNSKTQAIMINPGEPLGELTGIRVKGHLLKDGEVQHLRQAALEMLKIRAKCHEIAQNLRSNRTLST